MKTLKKITGIIALLITVLTLILLIAVRGALSPFTEPFKTSDGTVVEESVSELSFVTIGGMEQAILVRGENRSNPVLLWLHGGPGAAQMPLAHHLDRELEKEFVVVHWDQRGAGKSNHRGFDEQSMKFDRYVTDAHELIGYLKERFEQEKIFCWVIPGELSSELNLPQNILKISEPTLVSVRLWTITGLMKLDITGCKSKFKEAKNRMISNVLKSWEARPLPNTVST